MENDKENHNVSANIFETFLIRQLDELANCTQTKCEYCMRI